MGHKYMWEQIDTALKWAINNMGEKINTALKWL